MRRVPILLLTLCLVADMAMPLMPGAFRLNTDESIEGLHVRTARVVVSPADRLPRPPRPIVLDDRTEAVQVITRRIEPNRRPAHAARPVRHLQPEASPQVSEDH
jgi:hypothetical protein